MADTMLTINELLAILKKYNHVELHVHHTWKPSHKDFNGSNHQRLQNGMRRSHMVDRGWDDIAQHVTLFPDGKFLTGRNFGKTPASIVGHNGTSKAVPFMVEMVGNFDKGNDVLKGAQLDSILQLAKFFHDQGKYIRFHRENASKTCPGTGIDKKEFLKMVREYGKKPTTSAQPAKPDTRYPDVPKDYWAYEFIELLSKEGIVGGHKDGKFHPEDPATRGQIAKMLALLYKKLKG